MNMDGVRDAVMRLMTGDGVEIMPFSFSNDMTTFANCDDILTLLVHIGYLGYDFDTKEVFIPNKEIVDKYYIATRGSDDWAPAVSSSKLSDEHLKAMWKNAGG